MILSDHEIREFCVGRSTREENDYPADSKPLIDPYNEDQLQPASYDVRLGNKFRVFERNAQEYVDLADPVDITKEVEIDDEEYFTLHPGEFCLAHTVEWFNFPRDLVGHVDGKSSLGRLGLMVHITAGLLDPGWRGRITLEMTSVHPLALRLHPGQLIAQVVFQRLTSSAERPYQGRYQGDEGVAPSRLALL